MPPEEQDINPELESILKQEMDNGEKLANIEATSEGSVTRLDDIAQNTEAQIVQGERNNQKLTEPLNKIVENTEPKEVQKVEITNISSAEDDTEDADITKDNARAKLFEMLRGPKGRPPVKGEDYYTEKERKEFEKNLKKYIDKTIPKIGEDFYTDEEISKVADGILARIRVPEDGYTPVAGVDFPTYDEFFKQIKEIVNKLPKPKDGEPGKNADPDDVATLLKSDKKFIKSLRGKDGVFTEKDRKDLTKQVTSEVGGEVERFISKVASKSYAMRDLTDTQGATDGQVMKKQSDGSWAPADESGSGGGTWAQEAPTGTINGSNTVFELSNTPVSNSLLFYVNGQHQRPDGNEYTLSGTTITMTYAPQSGDNYTDTLWAVYQT